MRVNNTKQSPPLVDRGLLGHLPRFLLARHVHVGERHIARRLLQTDAARFERLDEFLQLAVGWRLNGAQHLRQAGLQAALCENLEQRKSMCNSTILSKSPLATTHSGQVHISRCVVGFEQLLLDGPFGGAGLQDGAVLVVHDFGRHIASGGGHFEPAE